MAHINKDRGAWRTSRAGGPSCLSRQPETSIQTIQTNGAVAVVFHSFGSPEFALGARNVLQQRAPAWSSVLPLNHRGRRSCFWRSRTARRSSLLPTNSSLNQSTRRPQLPTVVRHRVRCQSLVGLLTTAFGPLLIDQPQSTRFRQRRIL